MTVGEWLFVEEPRSDNTPAGKCTIAWRADYGWILFPACGLTIYQEVSTPCLMSQYFEIHPQTPQPRLINQVVDILRSGGVVVYPTDSCYALGCMLDNKSGLERIYRIRRLNKGHHMSLVCVDLSLSLIHI